MAATIENEFGPYLYPNQYINFTAQSAVAIPGVSRFRVSTFKQRGSYSAVIRVISFTLPQPSELHIPDAVMNLADSRRGMVLVTEPAGSGKSTTLACLIDRINHEREDHIITLEDPLEFLHRHEKSIVSQREISTDTESYLTALRAALRQSPDVILLVMAKRLNLN